MNFPPIPAPLQKTFEPLAQRLLQPRSLARIATRMPRRLNHVVVEQLLNRVFAEQIEEGDFDFLQHRVLQVEMIDAGLFVAVSFAQNRMQCRYFGGQPGDSDVMLSITVSDAIDLIQQQVDPDTLFFQRKLRINGNTELAHHVKNTIDTLNPAVIPRFVIKLMQQYQYRFLRTDEN